MRAPEFLIPLSFCLIMIEDASSADQKMIKIFGEVLDASLEDSEIKSNEECVDFCFNQSGCMLVFMNSDGECLVFDYNKTENLTVVETSRAENFMVAFKIQFPHNECPNYDQLDLVVDIGEDPITWRRSGNVLTFTKCVSDWKMFERDDSKVICMQAFLFDAYTKKDAARDFCEEMGYVLTGVDSANETRWILDRILVLDPNIMQYYGFWLDGERTCPQSEIDCMNFTWSDGYTTGNKALTDRSALLSGINSGRQREECLTVAKTQYSTVAVNDVMCAGSENEIGVVCGYQLM